MSKQLTSARKNELEALAQNTIDTYTDGTIPVDLEHLASKIGVKVSTDDYNNDFEGLIVYKLNRLLILIHKPEGKKLNKSRKRYTLAHELAHCIIPEHRLYLTRHGLMKKLENDIHSDKIFEREAEYFASCLLMPKEAFIAAVEWRSFDSYLIQKISKLFKVSLIAAIKRYLIHGFEPIAVVYSKAGIVTHGHHVFYRSKGFPYDRLTLDKDNCLPPLSLAADLFQKGEKSGWYSREVKIWHWFDCGIHEANMPLQEACVVLKENEGIMSVLWR